MNRFFEKTVFESAARTASENSADIMNDGHASKGQLIVDVTALTATPSVTFGVEAKDPVTGKYVSVETTSAVSAVGISKIDIALIPYRFRIRAIHADADSITYSVGLLLSF